MADSNSQPPRCPCGFFGSSDSLGLCSKCYKEHQKKNHEADETGTGVASAAITQATLSKAFSQVAPLTTQELEASSEPLQESPELSSNATVEAPSEPTSTSDALSSPEEGSNIDRPDCFKSPAEVEKSGESTSNKRDRREDDDDVDRPVQKNKKRCFKCNCRMELAIRELGKCKCDYIFCQLHRLPEQHDCMYDHKEKGRKAAREKMISPKKHMGTSLRRIDSDSY